MDGTLETGVDQIHLIIPLLSKALDDDSGDFLHLLKGDLFRDLEQGVVDGIGLSSEGIVPLSSDEDEANLLVSMFLDESVCLAKGIGVIAAAESFIRRDENQADPFDLSLGQQGMIDLGKRRPKDLHQLLDLFGIRPCGSESLLRFLEPGDSDHLHGPGDLLDADDAPNSSLDLLCSEHSPFA